MKYVSNIMMNNKWIGRECMVSLGDLEIKGCKMMGLCFRLGVAMESVTAKDP
jgi:hypothetical protein